MKRSLLITGANGFVGTALMQRLSVDDRYRTVGLVRHTPPIPVARIQYEVAVDPLTDCPLTVLRETDTVIHLASRVHVMQENVTDPMAEFRRINVNGTLELARAAAAAGVRRFIFVSSIKVNGEATVAGHPFTAGDASRPVDPYGISKREAEDALNLLAAKSNMEVVIVRPVLVYGPGVKANFRSMMSWLSKGVPLPFGAIHNKRSLIALDNLVDLLVTCIDHPAAASQTFLASDGEDLSTTELLVRLGVALGTPAKLIPVPAALIKGAARLAGRAALSQRLCGSLQVDISKTLNLLGWKPPIGVDEALKATADNFLKEQQK